MSERIRIASGIFGWQPQERVSNRYGAIQLTGYPYRNELKTKNEPLPPASPASLVFFDLGALERLHKRRVHLTCHVLESRKSGHVGDLFLGIYPTQPSVGEVVDLGVGRLRTVKSFDDMPSIVLMPEDGRMELWFDPHKLYRLHDQTVNVFAQKTKEPCSPKPDVQRLDRKDIIDLGGGMQLVPVLEAHKAHK